MGKECENDKEYGSGNSVVFLLWKCNKHPALASTMANPCDFGTTEMSLTWMQMDKQEKKNASYRNSSYTLVAEGGLYKGCGASRKEMGTEKKKQAFQNCTPSVIKNVATHTCSSNTPASKGSVTHGVLAALWLQSKVYSMTSEYRKQVPFAYWLVPLTKVPAICMLFHILQATVQKRS